MRFSEVRETLRTMGVVVSKRGETIRLNHFGGLEDTARYTNNLEQALALGHEIALPHRRSISGRSA
ncbi:hypothetical protein [Aminobacter sp. HY435]|uniref:hypothetical protein n=1 Tax=Aminobacter sp. HY435 TaxID=2970917 RepID=UPI0022B9C32F|nr:hypothetical protein [Aminobacter sp. HY435]